MLLLPLRISVRVLLGVWGNLCSILCPSAQPRLYIYLLSFLSHLDNSKYENAREKLPGFIFPLNTRIFSMQSIYKSHYFPNSLAHSLTNAPLWISRHRDEKKGQKVLFYSKYS